MLVPEYNGSLRNNTIKMPIAIEAASGIRIFGRLLKSFIFTTDVAIIRNCNADAVIAIYPFTPQPIITHSIITAADIPVISGVGGGTTRGPRVVGLAIDAEQQGALGVVVNAPTSNRVIKTMRATLEVPIIVTVVSEKDDIGARIDSGATILNVSAGANTPALVAQIRQNYPDVPIIATGGNTEESIQSTIAAGANAITFTPPSTAELFKGMMQNYRKL